MERPTDVMMIGFFENEASRTRDEQIIKRAGGDHVRVKKVNFIKDAVLGHLVSLDSYELIIFMKTDKQGGLKVLEELKRNVNVNSMIVGVSSVGYNRHIRRAWEAAGANYCLVEPLTEEKMNMVFSNLKVGIEAGIYKKMLQVLIVDDDYGVYLRVDIEELFKQQKCLVSKIRSRSDDIARTTNRAYDIVLVTKVSTVQQLRAMLPVGSVMVGMASTPAEFKAFEVALGHGRVFTVISAETSIPHIVRMFNQGHN